MKRKNRKVFQSEKDERSQEVKQFGTEKPVHLRDHVMHKWESQKDALEIQSKLPLSIDYALAQLTHDVSKKYSHGIRFHCQSTYSISTFSLIYQM